MVPFETIDKLYRGVVLPALDYCDVVWHGCMKSASNKLEVVHNNALQGHLTEGNWGGRPWVRGEIIIWLSGFYKCYSPSYLNQIFVSTSQIHQHETRNCHGLYVPCPRTNILKRSFAYQGVLVWNSLPDHVKSACNLTTFKTMCKEFLVLS